MTELQRMLRAHLGQLYTPARNNYFYGKLLDVCHLEMEQDYFNAKRWLLNRLTLGSGVVCGLGVTPEQGQIVIEPGVAIDPLGREIIVPVRSRPIDPRRLTDACGRPLDQQATGEVYICLAYHECLSEMVPVLVSTCETERNCAPSTICERYKVLAIQGLEPKTPGCPLLELFNIDRAKPSLDQIHKALVNYISHPCAAPAFQPCEQDEAYVILAKIELHGDETISADDIDITARALVYSNALMHGLLLCMYEACCEGGHQPMADPPRVVAIKLQNPRGEWEQELRDPNQELTISPYSNTIEVRFSEEVDPDTVTTYSQHSNTPSNVSFLVVKQSPRGRRSTPVIGHITPGARLHPEVYSFTVNDDSGFTEGTYRVTLRGSGDYAIKDKKDGLALDGTPLRSLNDFPYLSGDGTPGGDFTFTFTVHTPDIE